MTTHEQPHPSKSASRANEVRTDVPGVYRRGSRYLAVTQRHGRRIKTSHATKAEACRAKAERQSGRQGPTREPFDTYAERWLVEYRGRTHRGLTPQTRRAYAQIMHTWVIPYFGRTALGDLGPRDVKDFVAYLSTATPKERRCRSERLAASSIRRILTPLKAMLAEARELELITADCARVRIVLPDRGRTTAPKVLSRSEIDQVLAALPARDRLLHEMLSKTGLRISEALGLKWGDLQNTRDGLVLQIRRQSSRSELRPKTKTAASTRDVAVVPSLERALSDARAASCFAADRDPIFATSRGTHADAANARRALRAATKAVGVPWATPHTFRHSLATELLLRGYDINLVARILGHRSPDYTRKVYIHVPRAPRFDDLDES